MSLLHQSKGWAVAVNKGVGGSECRIGWIIVLNHIEFSSILLCNHQKDTQTDMINCLVWSDTLLNYLQHFSTLHTIRKLHEHKSKIYCLALQKILTL